MVGNYIFLEIYTLKFARWINIRMERCGHEIMVHRLHPLGALWICCTFSFFFPLKKRETENFSKYFLTLCWLLMHNSVRPLADEIESLWFMLRESLIVSFFMCLRQIFLLFVLSETGLCLFCLYMVAENSQSFSACIRRRRNGSPAEQDNM